MSVLACITIKQCDGCGDVAVLQTDDEYNEFDQDWYDGTTCDFCMICKPLNTEKIAKDQAVLSDIAAAVRQSDNILEATHVS